MADCAWVQSDGERCRLWTCSIDEHCTLHKAKLNEVVHLYNQVVAYFATRYRGGMTMVLWLETYAKTHLFYILLVIGGVVGGHYWLQEHDARLKADAVVKQQEATVASLQQQIATTNAQAAAKVQTVIKIVHDAATPAQVVQAIPALTDEPLHARVAVDTPSQVSVDAQPLVQLLGQAKADAINLAACKADLTAETSIVAAKQTEIVALKKKPKFFKRAAGFVKVVGVGIGIGLLLGGHL